MSDYDYGLVMPWESECPSNQSIVDALCALHTRVALAVDPASQHIGDDRYHPAIRPSGLAVKRIFEAVERNVFGQTAMADIEHAPPYTFDSDGTRRYWVGKHDEVVSNWPTTRRGYSDVYRQGMLDGASEWAYSGGFLVCESCTSEDAQRIVDALNAIEEAGQ